MKDGSHAIVDYKTARYTSNQDALFKRYEAQLNAYAFIGDRLDLAPVRQLALVYMEPVTDEDTARTPRLVDDAGFSIGLRATVVPVDVRPDELIPPLLVKVLRLNELAGPPEGADGCSDCEAVDALLRLIG